MVAISYALSTILQTFVSRLVLATPENNFQLFAAFRQQQTLDRLQQLLNDINQQFSFGQRQVFNEIVISVFSVVSISSLDQPAFETSTRSQQSFRSKAPRDNGKTIVTTAVQHFPESKGKVVQAVTSFFVVCKFLTMAVQLTQLRKIHFLLTLESHATLRQTRSYSMNFENYLLMFGTK